MGLDVAPVLCGRRLEPVHGWSVGLVSAVRLRVGFLLSLGLDAVPLRSMELRSRLWVVLDARYDVEQMDASDGGEPSASRLGARPSAGCAAATGDLGTSQRGPWLEASVSARLDTSSHFRDESATLGWPVGPGSADRPSRLGGFHSNSSFWLGPKQRRHHQHHGYTTTANSHGHSPCCSEGGRAASGPRAS